MRTLSVLLTVLFFAGVSQAKGFDKVLKEFQEKKAVLLDVRELSEVRSGMVDGALWVPFTGFRGNSERYKTVVKNLDKKKTIYIYCASGGRAGVVEGELRKSGFSVKNLGGFSSLKNSGFPSKVIKLASPKPCPWMCGEKNK